MRCKTYRCTQSRLKISSFMDATTAVLMSLGDGVNGFASATVEVNVLEVFARVTESRGRRA